MNQRGRKSMASLAVVDGGLAGIAPIAAPPGLTDAERGVWQATVESKPADWFGSEHIPLMVEYVRQVCRGHVIDAQIKAFDEAWLATDEGLARFEKLTTLGTKTAGMIARLATNMRLTHQSVWRADKAGLGVSKGKKLWQREN